jgi:DNA modification methylase
MTDYRNRIKALEYVNSSDLTPHPGNWRQHPAAQAEALKGVLNEVGIAGALLAYRSERQGGALVVIDGHLRKEAAPQQWPVLILDVEDAEADYLLATHDPLAAMATADAGALDALLSSVQSGEAGVQAMLAQLADDAGLYGPVDDPQDAEPQIDRAEELREKWGVELGQLWRMDSRTPGQEHRLICGDCTDAAVVERVMGGERAAMVFTDPPYNVASNSKNYAADASAAMHDLKNAEWDKDFNISTIFPVLEQVMATDCTVYVCTSQWLVQTIWEWMWKWSSFCFYNVWCKPNPMPSLSKRHWTWATELIAYAVRGRYVSNFPSDGHALNWWDIAKHKDTKHPTEKPIEVPARAIGFSSDRGAIIFDGFSGSGTTLIAAENLSRQCRAVEISPGYVAVALERYSQAFNIEPELIT